MRTADARHDANPVRIEPAIGGRLVTAWTTPFALIGDSRIWITTLAKDADTAVRSLLRVLKISPSLLQARAQMLGDVAILRRMPADAPREYGPNTVQPVAFLEGFSEDEIAESLTWLSREQKA
ncbi:hypothetical protein [Brevundimonas sp.]|uniref:hypothetical protein n=1 Tax=Brevundimonas sp. TaxID=1871086 RepID=UPI00286BEB0F|nr:hypothetical protein [Brevundimonas sp.]